MKRLAVVSASSIGFLAAGAAVGLAVLYVFAQSLGSVDARAISISVFGAAAGGAGGRLGARRGTKGVWRSMIARR